MIPTAEDPTVYLGDVYVLEGDEVIGVMQAMKFRRYPRVLLNRFFTPADIKNPTSGSTPAANSARSSAQSTKLVSIPAPPSKSANVAASVPTPAPAPAAAPAPEPVPVQGNKPDTAAPPVAASDSTAAKALELVAAEAAIELSDLQDDVSFASLGVDSLMSLVIAEKLRQQLGITVSGSLFLEYPTVRDLRVWLDEYYS
jgi:monodictyphenone polyketide synthase